MLIFVQAKRLRCFVIVGYPQKAETCNYNSICFVNPEGKLVKTYQKAYLYETDETWAEEGPGFASFHVEGLGKVRFKGGKGQVGQIQNNNNNNNNNNE
jgi:protein N-terminal amidase